MNSIRAKDRDAVIQSLQAGVIPRADQHLIQVGRAGKLEAPVRDVKRLVESGSTFQVVIGEYGAGKAFFLNLMRSITMEHKLVTMHTDLNPDRRLHATGGQTRSLYAELAKNMATRIKPDSGTLQRVAGRFISQAKTEAKASGKDSEVVIREYLAQLAKMVNSYDFAEMITAYCKGFEEGNGRLKVKAIRWSRGKLTTRTDTRSTLRVRTIVNDASIYGQLKLLAQSARLADLSGLMVCPDELVNLYKLSNMQAHNTNYEQILRILNDSLQKTAERFDFVLEETPEFLMDTRHSLYSHPALQSRLAENSFAKSGLVDLSGPVIRLISLTPEDSYVLLQKLRHVYVAGDSQRYLLPDEALSLFIGHCSQRLEEVYFRIPRTTITTSINLLAVLEQNPGTDWRGLLDTVGIAPDRGGEIDTQVDADDKLATFQF